MHIFLEFCKKHVIICAVNSATPEDELRKIIKARNWDTYFRFVYGSPSSKYENSEIILKKTNINRADVVFFGDDVNDYNAAKLSTIEFIGINYSMKTKPTFNHYSDFSQVEF